MTTIHYHQAAEAELLEQIRYLEDRARGLGRLFFAEIQKAERQIARHPESSAEILPGIRKHVMRKFPYLMIYSIEEAKVLILAVAHAKRRPGYWISRG